MPKWNRFTIVTTRLCSGKIMLRKLPLLMLLAVWLAGCVTQPEKVQAPPPVQPEPKPAPVRQKQALPPPHVYLIISRQLAPYTEVADRLDQRLGENARRYDLPGSKAERNQLLQQITEDTDAQVVAIGLEAALFAKQLGQTNQVFCQVFNYTKYGLASGHSKGVSMLPGVEKTLVAWKSISPTLHDVAVISGSGLDEVLQRADGIAARQGIVLHPVIVANDKEYLYAYKQLADKVQGYWLLPDNRVLSVSTLKDVMNFSVRNGKQVVVFNEDLLRLGGLLSVSSSYDDIADKVLQRLKLAAHKDYVPGMNLLPLDDIELKVNPVMAQRLGLSIPDKYRDSAGDRKDY